MQFITSQIRQRLEKNYRNNQAGGGELDLLPVVKLFTPDANCTWLITEIYPDKDTLFGLCDLGLGFPELGTVSLLELQSLRGRLGLPIERDRWFTPKMSLRQYAEVAYQQRSIAA